MSFLHYDLGTLRVGEVVKITLAGNAANVRLMNTSNFNNYRNGGEHRYVGGFVKQSPVKLAVPSSDHWHVVVDMGGRGGRVNASVSVIR